MTRQIEVRAENVKRGDLMADGSFATQDAYKNGETVIIITTAGQDEYLTGQFVVVERV